MTTKEHNVAYRKIDRQQRLTNKEVAYIKQGVKAWLSRFNGEPGKDSRKLYTDLKHIINYIDFDLKVKHRDKRLAIMAICTNK